MSRRILNTPRRRTVTRRAYVNMPSSSQYGATWHLATISATATPGGAYADISFNGAHPVEVINLYDYAAGRSTFTGQPGELGRILEQWIADQDADEGHELTANGHSTLKRPRRHWLQTYIENS